jgi:hypothetical protein
MQFVIAILSGIGGIVNTCSEIIIRYWLIVKEEVSISHPTCLPAVYYFSNSVKIIERDG